MITLAKAPSNIALIKYMGKTDAAQNLPANPSISLTLNSLCTFAEIEAEKTENPRDQNSAGWIPELPRSLSQKNLKGSLPVVLPPLSEKGIRRILSHVERVRKELTIALPRYGLKTKPPLGLQIRSANTFPASAGIASSASSFAAVTLATALAIIENPESWQQAWNKETEIRKLLAGLSRQGSGSSCRSFDGPWVLWNQQEVTKLNSALPEMTNLVLLISTQEKEVSSSDAHKRITHSPLWNGRVERVLIRIEEMKTALSQGDLRSISRIAWQETWEMHSLFHTCEEPFTFWEPETVRVLKWVKPYLSDLSPVETPPIVTMDAGANIHFLVPSTQAEHWAEKLQGNFPQLKILRDIQGSGATRV